MRVLSRSCGLSRLGFWMKSFRNDAPDRNSPPPSNAMMTFGWIEMDLVPSKIKRVYAEASFYSRTRTLIGCLLR